MGDMNKGRAREIAKIVRDHDELWNQSAWVKPADWTASFVEVDEMRELLEQLRTDADATTNACGSTGCVAGWAAMLYTPAGSKLRTDSVTIELPPGFTYDGTRTPDLVKFAREALGLDDYQADWLFGSDRTQDEVLWALENENSNWDPDQSPFDRYDYDYDESDLWDDDLEDADA